MWRVLCTGWLASALALAGIVAPVHQSVVRADCGTAGIASLGYDSPRPIVIDGTVRSVQGYDSERDGWLYRVTIDVTETLEGPERDTFSFSAGTGDCASVQGDRFKAHDRLLLSAAGQWGEPDRELDAPLIWRYEWGDRWSLHGFTDVDRDTLSWRIRDATTRAEILALVAPDKLAYRLAPAGWQVSIPRPSSDRRLHDIVAWGGGFVALGGRSIGSGGSAEYQQPTIRLTDDGQHWRLVPAPFPEVDDQGWYVARLVTFRDALYAVGRHGRDLVVWRSTDGHRWSRVRTQATFTGETFRRFGDPVPLGITGVAATADRLVITADAAEDITPGHPVVWTTLDGDQWSRATPTGLPGQYLQDLAPGPTGYVARVCRCSRPDEEWLLIDSPDGVTWRTVGALPLSPLGTTYEPVHARYYAAVLEWEPGRHSFAALYASSDGTTWSRLLRGPTDAASIVGVAAGGDTLVLTGDGYGGEDPMMWSMVSRDAGATWSFSELPRSRADSCETRTLIGPPLVTIGTCDRALAWVGGLQDSRP